MTPWKTYKQVVADLPLWQRVLYRLPRPIVRIEEVREGMTIYHEIRVLGIITIRGGTVGGDVQTD